MGYRPALDGLRAVAVLAVLVFHHDPSLLPGGYLGVSLFFTLSGFLITRLLLAELDRTARIGLRAFWLRRVRRIVPLAWIGLGAAIVVVAIASPAGQRHQHLVDVRFALASVVNWHFLVSGSSYIDAMTVPSPVQHYWSLAIEEQFYVCLPIVMLATRRSHRALGAVLVTVIGGSLVLQLTASSIDRVYYGTDTRAAELAIGALAALLSIQPAVRRIGSVRRAAFDRAGWVAAAAASVLAFTLPADSPRLGDGVLVAMGLVWAVMIAAALGGATFRARLAHPLLVALGRLSFGAYVFHFPVYLLLTADRLGLPGPAVFAVRLGTTLAFAAVAHTLVEEPVRAGRAIKGLRQGLVVPAVAVVGVLAATVFLVAPATDLTSQGFVVSEPSAMRPVDVHASRVATKPAEHHITDASQESKPSAASQHVPRSTAAQAAGRTVRPVRLLVIGDSTAGVNGAALQDWGQDTGRAQVWVVNGPACAVHPGQRLEIRSGFLFRTPCDDFAQSVREEVDAVKADAVVVFLGSSQVGLWSYPDVPGFTGLDNPLIATQYATKIGATLDALEQLPVPVFWADLPLPAWDLAVFGERIGKTPRGEGPVSLNDAARWKILDGLDTTAFEGRTTALRWSYTDTIANGSGAIPTSVRPDGLHLDDAVARRLAGRCWVPLLEARYRDLVRRGAIEAAPSTWNVPSTGR